VNPSAALTYGAYCASNPVGNSTIVRSEFHAKVPIICVLTGASARCRQRSWFGREPPPNPTSSDINDNAWNTIDMLIVNAGNSIFCKIPDSDWHRHQGPNNLLPNGVSIVLKEQDFLSWQ